MVKGSVLGNIIFVKGTWCFSFEKITSIISFFILTGQIGVFTNRLASYLTRTATTIIFGTSFLFAILRTFLVFHFLRIGQSYSFSICFGRISLQSQPNLVMFVIVALALATTSAVKCLFKPTPVKIKAHSASFA